MAKSMAKSLAQLLHLEDTHKWMLVKDSVDEGGEGGGVAGEARVVDEARALGEAKLVDKAKTEGEVTNFSMRTEDEVTNLEVHHQASLLQEASQAVLHREGEEAQEAEGTQTAAITLKTF